jgi:hypothetical protein
VPDATVDLDLGLEIGRGGDLRLHWSWVGARTWYDGADRADLEPYDLLRASFRWRWPAFDLTLAIDNHGKIYLNEGHICGGIIHFIINDKIAVKAASDFIQHFISDTDDRGWKSLNKECIKTSFTSK